MAEPYDVAILGDTPAGCAAAGALASAGRRVIVVRTDKDDQAGCNLCDWVGKGFFGAKMLGQAVARSAEAREFKEVCYHNVDFTQQTSSKPRTRAGWFVHTSTLTKALGEAAASAGAKFWAPRNEPQILLEEDGPRLKSPTKTVRARVLLIACKRPSEIVGDLSLPMRTVPATQMTVAGLDVSIPAAVAEKADGMLHVVEPEQKQQLGLFFVVDRTLHIRVICQSSADAPGPALSRLVSRLQDGGLLPGQLNISQANGKLWRPPAGVALDLESHVAKRCLLLGTAGGFVEAATGQVLSPSVQSALLAASVTDKALKSSNCQAELMEFENVWRSALADFMRPPNTSLQLLLPLLFSNKRIADRLTAALLDGKNI